MVSETAIYLLHVRCVEDCVPLSTVFGIRRLCVPLLYLREVQRVAMEASAAAAVAAARVSAVACRGDLAPPELSPDGGGEAAAAGSADGGGEPLTA